MHLPGDESLLENLGGHVSRGQDEGTDLEWMIIGSSPRARATRMSCVQRRGGHVRAATVGDDIDPLELRTRGQSAVRNCFRWKFVNWPDSLSCV